MFLREYVPHSYIDAWTAAFEKLRHCSMTVSEYAVWFSDLARHALALVVTVRERFRRFIDGLNPSIRFSMTQEFEMDITYQQVVGIARRLKGMLTREREEREAKRSRDSGTYSCRRAPVAACHGRVYVSRPIHSALPASSGILATPRPQAPYYALPLFNAPSTRGTFSDLVAFWGHVVLSEGIKVDPKKIDAVQIWPRPSSAMEIQSFLGLAWYYCRFVEVFSSTAAPMTRLTQKGALFRWTVKFEESFQKLKTTLTITPVLVLPTDKQEVNHVAPVVEVLSYLELRSSVEAAESAQGKRKKAVKASSSKKAKIEV
ncbi:uncharacterized protein [Nicotiana tomentosiformis]|uniref:uncharacterized protein n=1 Tax=Nicotiana tomentosiformis TaxID=4098 RepID=UPI00388CAEA6